MVARMIKYRIPKYSNRDGETDAQKGKLVPSVEQLKQLVEWQSIPG